MGERNDVETILSIIDIVVFPSLYEGVPLVVLEAQASRTRVLYSDVIGEEVEITPYVKKKSLNTSAREWASAAIQFCSEKINCNIEKSFEDKEYTIKAILTQLYRIYGEK